MFESYLIGGFILTAVGWLGANTAFGRRLFDARLAPLPIAALVFGTAIFARGLWLFVRR
ncbi:MAG: hypothetical protein JNM66_16020 [Bryobacterales bacterium]|nr:hypothetical protein [Bryobacterales bacterium]